MNLLCILRLINVVPPILKGLEINDHESNGFNDGFWTRDAKFSSSTDFQLFHSQNNNLMINCSIVSSRKLKVKKSRMITAAETAPEGDFWKIICWAW